MPRRGWAGRVGSEWLPYLIRHRHLIRKGIPGRELTCKYKNSLALTGYLGVVNDDGKYKIIGLRWV